MTRFFSIFVAVDGSPHKTLTLEYVNGRDFMRAQHLKKYNSN